MDHRKNHGYIHWDVKRGDLVRVTNHIFTSVGNKEEFLYGLAIGMQHTNQITLFPEIEVYLFKTKAIRTFTAGSLEIISHA